jgi:hypothetical protein
MNNGQQPNVAVNPNGNLNVPSQAASVMGSSSTVPNMNQNMPVMAANSQSQQHLSSSVMNSNSNVANNPMAAMHGQAQNAPHMNTHGMNPMMQNQMNMNQMKFMQQQQQQQQQQMLRNQQMLGPPPEYKPTAQANPQMMPQAMHGGGRFPNAAIRQHAQRQAGNG